MLCLKNSNIFVKYKFYIKINWIAKWNINHYIKNRGLLKTGLKKPEITKNKYFIPPKNNKHNNKLDKYLDSYAGFGFTYYRYKWVLFFPIFIDIAEYSIRYRLIKFLIYDHKSTCTTYLKIKMCYWCLDSRLFISSLSSTTNFI